jgi:hypothetical protein
MVGYDGWCLGMGGLTGWVVINLIDFFFDGDEFCKIPFRRFSPEGRSETSGGRTD